MEKRERRRWLQQIDASAVVCRDGAEERAERAALCLRGDDRSAELCRDGDGSVLQSAVVAMVMDVERSRRRAVRSARLGCVCHVAVWPSRAPHG